MRAINNFALECHAGEYQSRPSRSRLLRDGTALDISLPGYSLLRQYATVGGYLFVTDYDCPFEEKTCFTLVDKDLERVLSSRAIGWMYGSFSLDDLFWHDERNFTAVLSGQSYHLKIRKFYIPYLHPKLGFGAISK